MLRESTLGFRAKLLELFIFLGNSFLDLLEGLVEQFGVLLVRIAHWFHYELRNYKSDAGIISALSINLWLILNLNYSWGFGVLEIGRASCRERV